MGVVIDRQMVRRAAGLAGAGHPVQVNVSAGSVADPSLHADLERALLDERADPVLVVLELTETILLADEVAGRAFVERVQSLGCRGALDDIGGGLRDLGQSPVDHLKIDAELVRGLGSNEASRHLVEAVVGLALAFGQRTVAEGVEDRRTLRLLLDPGVDYAQGLAVAAPAPSEVLEAAARAARA